MGTRTIYVPRLPELQKMIEDFELQAEELIQCAIIKPQPIKIIRLERDFFDQSRYLTNKFERNKHDQNIIKDLTEKVVYILEETNKYDNKD